MNQNLQQFVNEIQKRTPLDKLSQLATTLQTTSSQKENEAIQFLLSNLQSINYPETELNFNIIGQAYQIAQNQNQNQYSMDNGMLPSYNSPIYEEQNFNSNPNYNFNPDPNPNFNFEQTNFQEPPLKSPVVNSVIVDNNQNTNSLHVVKKNPVTLTNPKDYLDYLDNTHEAQRKQKMIVRIVLGIVAFIFIFTIMMALIFEA
ncbi:hypothetical protein M0811_09718 [Anaeramoeba ignava]|uniref:Transmembrane protein n=1 Tax=Anaeramoeba ignava TaxID=1746090 RepID=A0A9Q0RAU9_ANAIG|nr:hypothetical protein M0811_09718 [Anaeramoeba ignava]